MKRSVHIPAKGPVVPTDAEFAAMWGTLGDKFDDRVSASLVEYDDEREAVEALVPGIDRYVN